MKGPLGLVIRTSDIDLAAAPDLEKALATIRQRNPADVVIDVTAVTFLGCTGLDFQAELGAYLSGLEHRLYLVTSSPAALRLPRLGGVESALTVLDHAHPKVRQSLSCA